MSQKHAGDHPEDFRAGAYPLLLDLLNALDEAQVTYKARPASVRVAVRLPGWRWEMKFTPEGGVETERFRSIAGVEHDPMQLERLSELLGRQPPPPHASIADPPSPTRPTRIS
jgi:hypothetical protein